MTYQVHTLDSAPEASRAVLRNLNNTLGMIPNLAATMAESPELLRGFLTIREIFYKGSFSAGEIQVLALTNAYENGCRYCMALHSTSALAEGVPDHEVVALRRGESPADPRLRALSDFSRALVRERGQITSDHLAAFLAAGYTRAQALEVVLGVAVSILPNFAHHITDCPIDEVFQPQLWTAVAA